MTAENEKVIGAGSSGCPDSEILSDYFDSGFDSSHPAAAHIRDCPKCLEILNTYGIIDQRLKRAAKAAVPDDLLYSVKLGFERKLKASEERKSITFPAFLLRVAAVAVLCSCAALILWSHLSVKPESGATPAIAAVQAPDTKEISSPGMTCGLSKYLPPEVDGVIPLHKFANVSFSGSESPRPYSGLTEDSSAKSVPVSISPRVRQVWVTGDIKNCREKLASIAKFAGVSQETISPGPDKDSLTVKFLARKRSVVDFVRLCGGAGFVLVSPDAPQPEDSLFFGNENDQTVYTAEFVQSQKAAEAK
jgi:hypothetical protein